LPDMAKVNKFWAQNKSRECKKNILNK